MRTAVATRAATAFVVAAIIPASPPRTGPPLPFPPLVLASGSRYRRELLERLRLPFAVEPPDVDEAPIDGERPVETALRLSRLKAAAVAARHPSALVIGSDQVAESDGEAFGKPGTHEAAAAQLRRLSGRVVRFHSGLCVIAPAAAGARPERSAVVETTVRFRALDDGTIERYLAIEEPYDCAGSAKAEALGIALLERIDSDDPTALIGLPLIALVSMLVDLGFPPLGPR